MSEEKVIASCSCGKDSLAMTYESIDRGLLKPGDKIVFFSNGMDFKCIYKLWDDLKEYAEVRGIECITIEPKKSFLHGMFDEPHKGKHDGIIRYGYGWCGGACRWGTHDKIVALDNFFKSENGYQSLVGIAIDEPDRLDKERACYKTFPLAEWGWTEQDCLDYCHKRDIRWLEWSEKINDYVDLYDILDRVSCWCCANKNQWELYNIWYYFPDTYWKALLDIQSRLKVPFKKPNKDGKYGYTLHELEQRFEKGFIPKHRKRRNENK